MRCFILIGLLLSHHLLALPLGNPADPALYTTGLVSGDPYNIFRWKDAGMIRVGFYGQYVRNAHLAVDSNTQAARHVRDTRIMTNAGMLVFNAFQFVDLYGTLGTSRGEVHANGLIFSPDPTLITIGTNEAISWSIGGRGILWRYSLLTIGAQAQYFHFQTKINYIRRHDSGAIHVPNSAKRYAVQFWQAGLGAAATIGAPDFQLVPYCGLRWTGGQIGFKSFTELFPGSGVSYNFIGLIAEKLWGISVGVTALAWQKISVNAEGQFGDESALSVNGQINF